MFRCGEDDDWWYRRYSSALKRVLNKTILRWIEIVSRLAQNTQSRVQYVPCTGLGSRIPVL